MKKERKKQIPLLRSNYTGYSNWFYDTEINGF